MKLLSVSIFSLVCFGANAMPMMRIADKFARGYLTVSAATGTIGALLSANNHWQIKDGNGEQDVGTIGSMTLGFLVGSSVPTAFVAGVYELAKSGSAIYLFPNGDHANKIRVYRQLNDNTVRGWNGQQWVDVAFDAKQCVNKHDLKYGYKGTHNWFFQNPEIIKTLDASRKKDL